MLLRTFAFRVRRGKERAMRGFMRRKALRLLKRLPGCLAAYFMRSPDRKDEYVWVTLWVSEAARARAMRRKDWQALVQQETKQFFRGRPRVRHYQVLLRK